MKKEQFSIRVLPITKYSLDEEVKKNGSISLNDLINSILEDYITKKKNEEKTADLLDKKFEEIQKFLKETNIELDYNKRLLARICGKIQEKTGENLL